MSAEKQKIADKAPSGAVGLMLVLGGAGLALFGLVRLNNPPEVKATAKSGPKPEAPVSLEDGFTDPPMSARPSVEYVLGGSVNRTSVDTELQAFRDAGLGGLDVSVKGARGAGSGAPPAGSAFMSPESVLDIAHIARKAAELGMTVDLDVGVEGPAAEGLIKREDAAVALYWSETEVEGPVALGDSAPPLPTPSLPDLGSDEVAVDVAVLAIRNPERMPGHEFVFDLGRSATVERAALHNAALVEGEPSPAKAFSVALSQGGMRDEDFRIVAKGPLKARTGPQEFRFPPGEARFVRLQISGAPRAQLAEFELYAPQTGRGKTKQPGRNVLQRAMLVRASGNILAGAPAAGAGPWAANNLYDGRVENPEHRWASSGLPPIIAEADAIVDVTDKLGRDGRLAWQVPEGRWAIQRFVYAKAAAFSESGPGGRVTDPLNRGASERYVAAVLAGLAPLIADGENSPLRKLYLPAHRVAGQLWTPNLPQEFQRRRGYALLPYLPILNGGVVGGQETRGRVLDDFHRTVSELLVDAYYQAAGGVTRKAGLQIESEAGAGFDSLLALGSADTVRGAFTLEEEQNGAPPPRVKEAAAAAHIYGKQSVHAGAFAGTRHWQDAPASFKAAADHAFSAGMNHVVWQSAIHQSSETGQPSEAGQPSDAGQPPGDHTGTQPGPNHVWWPTAKPFLAYLARTSFMLRQGLFVGDVLFYVGDKGEAAAQPRAAELRSGYDYDVTNAHVILKRLGTRGGKLVLPDGMSYELLVLPESDQIDLEVLQKIDGLVQAGATVVGRKPTASPGLDSTGELDKQIRALAEKMWGDCDGEQKKFHLHGRGRVVCGGTLRDLLLERNVSPDLHFEGTAAGAVHDLGYTHRRTSDTDIYFVHNRQPTPADIDATFRVRGKVAEIWQPETGARISPYAQQGPVKNGTKLRLRLEANGSLFVVFRGQSGEPSAN